jgi:hypothetical protein
LAAKKRYNCYGERFKINSWNSWICAMIRPFHKKSTKSLCLVARQILVGGSLIGGTLQAHMAADGFFDRN